MYGKISNSFLDYFFNTLCHRFSLGLMACGPECDGIHVSPEWGIVEKLTQNCPSLNRFLATVWSLIHFHSFHNEPIRRYNKLSSWQNADPTMVSYYCKSLLLLQVLQICKIKISLDACCVMLIIFQNSRWPLLTCTAILKLNDTQNNIKPLFMGFRDENPTSDVFEWIKSQLHSKN